MVLPQILVICRANGIMFSSHINRSKYELSCIVRDISLVMLSPFSYISRRSSAFTSIRSDSFSLRTCWHSVCRS